MRLREEGPGRGPNRAAASHLAKRAERADFLTRMQVCRAVSSTADTRRRFVVMEDFDREKLKFTGQGKAGNECMHPVSVSRFS